MLLVHITEISDYKDYEFSLQDRKNIEPKKKIQEKHVYTKKVGYLLAMKKKYEKSVYKKQSRSKLAKQKKRPTLAVV